MSVLKKSRSNEREVQQRLERAYDKYGLVLLLGAGVSGGSGLPRWSELVRRIMTNDQVFGEALGSTKYDALTTSRYRLETIVRMAELKVNQDYADRSVAKSAFSSIIRESLYGGPDFKDWWRKDRDSAIDINADNAREFADFISKNQSLKAVYDLCVMFGDTQGEKQSKRSKRNPNIHAVINFNLDLFYHPTTRPRI
jgi:hypothetical protein